MKQYADFEIRIGTPLLADSSKGIFPVYAQSSIGGPADGQLLLDLTDQQFKADLAKVRGIDPNLELRQSFGEMLFKALFADDVRDLWNTSVGRIEGGEADGLRLHLWIDVPDLAILPWELIKANEFLATASDRTVSRYLPGPEPPALPTQKPLRILIVTESPQGLPIVEPKEVENLEYAIKRLGDNIQSHLLPNPSVTQIQNALQQEYHVLHFLGHGSGGKLFLTEDDGKTRLTIGDREFGQLFLGRRSMRLVVLNACNSAQADPAGLFTGIGPALVQKRVPAVVAMQYPFVQLDTASQFSERFYSALANGLPVDVAINEGRQFISAGPRLEDRDWSTPVLYMGTRSGRILDFLDDKGEEVDKAWHSVKAATLDGGKTEIALNELTRTFKQLATQHQVLGELMNLTKCLETVHSDFSRCSNLVGPMGITTSETFNNLMGTWENLRMNSLNQLETLVSKQGDKEVSTWFQPLQSSAFNINDNLEKMAYVPLTASIRDFGHGLAKFKNQVGQKFDSQFLELMALSQGTLTRLSL
jgi:CHAT domain